MDEDVPEKPDDDPLATEVVPDKSASKKASKDKYS